MGAPESALEPELEIVDPHHHLWDFETPYGRYEIDELRLDTGAGHNIVQTVFVECESNLRTDGPEHLRPVGETEYVERQANVLAETQGSKIAGIVATADLRHPAAAETLDAHLAASDRFRGIRQRLNRAAGGTPSLYNDPAFHSGCRELASRGHTLDAWQYHFQLANLVAVAKAVPELTIIVNHLGGPLATGSFAGQRDAVHEETKTGLAELAAFENVVIKVGGIGMERFGTEWLPAEGRPSSDDVVAAWGDLMRWTIETFGPSRSMFESNFSVDGVTTDYVVLWNAFKKVSADLSVSERADLFAGTARRVYRLEK